MSYNRLTAVEALRFLSVFQICLWHMGFPGTAAGFLGVEFFFILGGIFMYKAAVKPNSPGTLAYSWHKLSKFWFKTVLALILTYAIYWEGLITEFKDNWVYPIMKFISEALMLQVTGCFEYGVNCPSWFFATLIYGGAFVYLLAKYYTKLSIRLVFPAIAIFYFAYTFNNGTTETLENWDVIGGFVPLSMARGIAEIGFGVVIGYMYFNYSQFFYGRLKVFNVASVLSLILYIAIVADNRQLSQYAFIFIPILICAAMTPGTVISKLLCGKFWIFLGRISFDIYIIHYPLIAVFRHFLLVVAGLPFWLVATLYYISLIPAAWIFDKTAVRIQKFLFRPNNNGKIITNNA